MKDKALPIIAILASTIAIGLSLNRTPSADDDRTGSHSLDQLERRLQRLEAQIARDSRGGDRQLSGLTDTDVIDPELGGDTRSLADLRARQDDLEGYLNQLGVFEHFESFKQKISDSYAVTIDPSRSAKERLTSLAVLREAGKIDADVVNSMVTVWNESLEDGKAGGLTRYYLLENLEGVSDPQFRDSILEWLPDEESPKMRARAIETLGPMMPDPGVEEWLTYLGENDPEPKVRQLAADTRTRASENK